MGKIWNSTLKRKTPLKAKTGLKTKPSSTGTKKWNQSLKWAAQSQKRKKESREYSKERKLFLEAYPVCQVSRIIFKKKRPTDQIHHMKGRAGSLYLDQRFWLAMHWEAHEWVEQNKAEARKLGLLFNKVSDHNIKWELKMAGKWQRGEACDNWD